MFIKPLPTVVTILKDSLAALTDVALDAEPPALALHTPEIVGCLRKLQDQLERAAALITAKEYARKLESVRALRCFRRSGGVGMRNVDAD